jgi:hypothetical protein
MADGATPHRRWFRPHARPLRARGAALVVAALAVPPAVLLHEAGHYWTDRAFGVESSIHYASTGFPDEAEFWKLVRAGNHEGASKIADVRGAGWSALAGLLVSYGMIGLGVWGVRRSGRLACLVLASAPAMRFPLVLPLALLGRSEHTDEAHVADALGVPPGLLWSVGLLLLLAATVGVWGPLDGRGRARLVSAVWAGLAVGTVAWLGVLGPAMLP